MTTTLLKIVADLENSLASAVSVGATTATLTSALDGDGVSLPAGKYGFTIDSDNSAKEFIVCDLSGTTLTNIESVSLQGAVTSGFSKYHRVGATVTVTDWVILARMLNNLNGTTGFDSGTALKYDGQPTLSDPTAIPTVQYVLDIVNGGTVSFNRQIIAGDAGETIVAGDWVYFNTADGEWYKTDADDVAKSLNVRIGKAVGAGTDGLPITGGIFVSGTETVGTYVAGTTYYLSNTAGELSTSAGTNTVIVGIGDANGNLQLQQPTPNQINAMGGDGATPNSLNPFATSIRRVNAGATINGATTPVPVYQNTTDNKVYACDANDTATLKFIGFATTNSTDGNPISIKTTGVVSGFTGLTEGPYYVSDTAGTIQTTPGTNTVLVGWAISETELVIQKGSRYTAGAISSTISASGSQAITCGFRPSIINITARNVSTVPELNSVDIVWVNGSIYGVSVLDNGASSFSESGTNLYDNTNINSLTFTITSVTDTGFTITWTEGGSYNILTNIIWSAQGDI